MIIIIFLFASFSLQSQFNGLLLESEWQHVPSCLDGPSTIFSILATLKNGVIFTVSILPLTSVHSNIIFKAFGEHYIFSTYNWYNCHLHVQQ